VPGVRFAVNVSMGLIEYPYRRFLLYSAIGGVSWAIYTCLLAYWIGGTLGDFPIASIVISGVVTTVLIGAVYVVDRRRRGGETEPGPVPGGAGRSHGDADAR
jgi:membrane protein DedA with SNARE-associated domain